MLTVHARLAGGVATLFGMLRAALAACPIASVIGNSCAISPPSTTLSMIVCCFFHKVSPGSNFGASTITIECEADIVGGAECPQKLDREIFVAHPSVKIGSLENFRLYSRT